MNKWEGLAEFFIYYIKNSRLGDLFFIREMRVGGSLFYESLVNSNQSGNEFTND